MNTREQLDRLGKRILEASRTELFLSMRFMGSALDSLSYVMDLNTRTCGTDAANIRFNPTFLMQLYIERPRNLNRLYVHMLLHCIFRHMFGSGEHEVHPGGMRGVLDHMRSIVDSFDFETFLAPPETE